MNRTLLQIINWKARTKSITALALLMLIGIFTSSSAYKSTKFEHGRKSTRALPSKTAASELKLQEQRNISPGSRRNLAGPILDVSTTLIGVSCDKQATYEVNICNTGDEVANGVTPNLIPENSGFVLKSVSAGPGFSMANAGYTDPGGDTQTMGYDGYGFAALHPCTTTDYHSSCTNYNYNTFNNSIVASGAFSFPPLTAGSGVPQGAIILSAKLKVKVNASGVVVGLKRSDLTVFSSTSHPGDLYYQYATSSSVPAKTTEMNVTAIAQELVNQTDWTDNSNMAFFWAGATGLFRNSVDEVSVLEISYIEPATIAPGECATLTYVYDVSAASPGTYQMSADVNTTTLGTTFSPNTDFSVSGLTNLNGYNGTEPTNTTDDTVIPESYLPVLDWTCPGPVMSDEKINIAATTSNTAAVVLSSATSGNIANTGTTQEPAAAYTPTAQDISNGFATLSILSTSPNGCTQTTTCNVTVNPALPVTLIDFSAAKQENSILLQWRTASEANSHSFEIQRSINGKVWNAVGVVSAHFESNSIQKYSFTDAQPEIVSSLYRLKMIDMDNTFSYSRIQEVKGEKNLALSVYPNPVSDELIVSLNPSDISEIQLINLIGNQVYTASLVGKVIPVKKYTDGLYLLVITHKSGEIQTQKVIIKH